MKYRQITSEERYRAGERATLSLTTQSALRRPGLESGRGAAAGGLESRRYDSRGRLAGKRHVSERPAAALRRQAVGHWEIDTVMGTGNDHCIVTLVERATGYLMIAKLAARNMDEAARRTIDLVRKHPAKFPTITADNGTEFHSYKEVEMATGVKFYFSTPHRSWERGTNENTNGLIRQYLPKRTSMARITQRDCNAIANKLNRRPRKRHDYHTPEERFHEA